MTDLSWVRLRIGDTSSGTAKFADEEINILLGNEGNKYLAAAVAAESIGASLSGSVDKTIGKLSISKGQASERYFALATRLRFEASMHAQPYAGGISADDKREEEGDTDRVTPGFTADQFAFTGSDPSTADC
jgi:hypothetical protein